MIFGSTAGTTRLRGLCVDSLVENGVFGAGARFIEQVSKFDMVVAWRHWRYIIYETNADS
jgi:hypothetical protein